MQETIQGIAIVKAFTMEDQLAGKVDGMVDQAEERSNKIARALERTGADHRNASPASRSPAVIGYAGLSAPSTAAVRRARSSPSSPRCCWPTTRRAAWPACRSALERAAGQCAHDLRSPRHRAAASATRPAPSRSRSSKGEIALRGRVVRLRPRAMPVLQDVSFTAEGGKTTAIVGASGAGKSTLIACCSASTISTAGRS